ncbi:GNAT family N-acetyltransferase [Candidatus Leptofilum sp.]|uniref:GNAT family N-acetyltransferase n=1 Tax=Candidatus Leptofilum sp. TaxID=3241576 RepID=UPI003B5BBB3D
MFHKIRLEPVTVNNWKSCIALETTPNQEGFVPSNLYSIAESQFYEGARSNAFYNEQNQLIGYALWGRDVFTDKWKIFRIMIDKSHQNQGYGKSAMKAIIKQISKELNGNEVLICYQITNSVARTLYANLGFVEQDIDPDGKVTALLKQDTC